MPHRSPSQSGRFPVVLAADHERPFSHSPAEARYHVVVLGLLLMFMGLAYPLLGESSYRGTGELHLALELLSGTLGLLVGLGFITHSYSLGQRFYLLVGLAFLVSGIEDGLHGFFEAARMHPLAPGTAGLNQAIPATYISGRMLMGLLLVLAPFFPSWMRSQRNPRRETILVSIIVGVVAVLATFMVLQAPLAGLLAPRASIARPLDFASAMLLALALAVFLREYRRTLDKTTWWLALSIGMSTVGQLMISFSKTAYDPLFNVAHVYKTLAYAAPLLGFFLYQVSVILELKRAEEVLGQDRNLLRTLIDNLPDCIYVKDLESRFVAGNAAVARIMRAESPDALLGKTDHDFYPKTIADEYCADEQRVFQAGLPLINKDEPVIDQNGTMRAVLTTKVPLRDSHGNVVGLVGISRDITERKRAEQDLRRAHDDLELRVRQRTAELAEANEELKREIAERVRAQEVLLESEVLYSSLVENLPVHVVRKDLDGRFVFANRLFCTMLGRPLEAIVGKTDFDFFPEPLARKFREDDQHVAATGELMRAVEENRTDGEERYMEVIKAPVRDAAGKTVGVQMVFWDVTQRRRAEAALEQERNLLHALMDHLPHKIYFKDAESRFARVNQAQAAWLGLGDAAEAIGTSDRDYFAAEHADEAMADERQIMRTGRPIVDKEEKETWPDGRTTWALSTKMPLRDVEGRIVGTFGISRDITEQKQVAEALRAAKEAAEAASRAKSTFLANMSHEIRTPLNAIIGMTELVLKSQLAQQQREYLATVRDSGEALLSVINDILDFSKIEAGKLVLDHDVFDLRESLGDTMKSFALRAHQQGLELACHIHTDVPRMVVGDYNRLREIIVNLVGNAIKFTERGEVVLEAEVESVADGDAVLHFIITDTGIGVPEDKQSLIFEMFEQADASMTRRRGGTGLGLAIASRLVELMHGRIWIESQVGRGSRFHFTIRLGLARPEEIETVLPEPDCLHEMRTLVVDDNATNRRILEEMLRGWRMAPVTADGADAAIDVLREAHRAGQPFHLILTDAHMPDVDGFMFAERVKQDADLADTVIVMLTSGDREEDAARCAEVGIRAYLLKPVKQSELLESIERALGLVVPGEGALRHVESPPSRVGCLRILLAEDSVVNQRLAVALLEGAGHTVRVAGNGREAVEAVARDAFDLILMDVQMPEMDGLEATGQIRAAQRSAGVRTPIIAMTAHALKGDRERCLEAGMDAYIAKPVRADELFRVIESHFTSSDQPAAAAVPAPPPPAPEADEMVDWPEALEAVRGNRRLLRTIVEAAIEESPRLMAGIDKAIAAGDPATLRLVAHTLKGSIRYFGPNRAAELAFQLERMGQEKNLAEAQQTFVALETEIRRLMGVLADYLRHKPE